MDITFKLVPINEFPKDKIILVSENVIFVTENKGIHFGYLHCNGFAYSNEPNHQTFIAIWNEEETKNFNIKAPLVTHYALFKDSILC